MGKFHYCSSEDELLWRLDPGLYDQYIRMIDEQLIAQRFDIQRWVENTCTGDVIVWNEVSVPNAGDQNWHKKILPEGNARLYFSDEKDVTMFMLRWIRN